MRTKFQVIMVALTILIGGLLAPFLPNIVYNYAFGPINERISNLPANYLANKFSETFPFLILSLFSLLLLYTPQSASPRLRRLSGIITAFIFIFAGTFDANRPLSYSHYDIGPGPGFFDFIFIPPLYVLGYFLGWLWEMIHGVKDEISGNSPDKK